MPRKKIIIGIIAIIILMGSYLIITKIFGSKSNETLNPQLFSETLTKKSIKIDNSLELEFSNPSNPEPGQNTIIVDNAVICLDVRDRMPINETQHIDTNMSTIYCWTMLLNGEGKRIRYLWYIGDDITASQWLTISSNKFRAWCPKAINNKTTGAAHVDVVDETGKILKTIGFEIVPARTSKLHVKYS
jgi:hypothetical protein